MHELLALARAVTPVVAVLILGRLLGRWGLLTAQGSTELNRLVYWVGLPAQLIVVVSASDLREAFDPAAVAAAVIGFAIVLVGVLVVTRRLPAPERGTLASGVARANAAYIGLPVVTLAATALTPETGARLVAIFPVLLAIMVPVFNIGSVLGFIVPTHGLRGGGWKKSLRELPKNPLILACIFGIALAWFRPAGTEGSVLKGTMGGDALDLLARSSLPLALLVTGAALDLRAVLKTPIRLGVAACGKLVIAPAVVAGLAWCFGASEIGIAAATVLMACPTAVANVPMARQLGGDEPLMAAQVALTTVISPITLVMWLAILT